MTATHATPKAVGLRTTALQGATAIGTRVCAPPWRRSSVAFPRSETAPEKANGYSPWSMLMKRKMRGVLRAWSFASSSSGDDGSPLLGRDALALEGGCPSWARQGAPWHENEQANGGDGTTFSFSVSFSPPSKVRGAPYLPICRFNRRPTDPPTHRPTRRASICFLIRPTAAASGPTVRSHLLANTGKTNATARRVSTPRWRRSPVAFLRSDAARELAMDRP